MNRAAAPHRLLCERPGTCLLTVASSLLLSCWAVYLDPVVNPGGVDALWAAGHFAAGDWRAGFAVYDRPAYAVLVALAGKLPGLSDAYAGYALTAGFHALLALGFVALAASLLGSSGASPRGERRVPAMAAVVVLLLPALNSLRSGVSADPAYWACGLWAMAWFVHYAGSADRRSAALAAGAGLFALLLGLEALVLLLVAPLWLAAGGRAGGTGWPAHVGVAVVAVIVLLAYALWQKALAAGTPLGALLLGPVEHLETGWRGAGQALGFKLEGLRSGFLDRISRDYGQAALLVTVVVILLTGLVKTLSAVYAALVLYSAAIATRLLAPDVLNAWRALAAPAVLLLLVPAATRFDVEPAAAMTAALILLAVVPPALERLRRDGPASGGLRRWGFPAVMTLVVASGAAGLDLRRDEHHLREAGLWLRAHAGPDSELISNSRIVIYYSGLRGDRRPARFSWRQTMNRVHRDRLGEYDYLALAIGHAQRHREGILMRWLELEPIRIVANEAGDRVLIFRLGE